MTRPAPAGHAIGPTVPPRPRRADGLVLLGEFAGSGLDRPVQLARRADGQVVALTTLLAHILTAADGARDVAAIAAAVAALDGRAVTGADVALLVTERLIPLGLVAPADGEAGPAPRAAARFTLVGRHTLLPAPAVARLSARLAGLLRPAVIVVSLLALVGTDIWVFGRHSLAASAAAVLAAPSLLATIVALTLLGALVHECGHAAACRYGGATPGVIGVGMYLVWPAFFTDVTDSYRLSRGGRLRTDLGGIYFNGLYSLALAGALALTHAQVLVTAIVLAHLDATRQLAPFVRLDGYYIVADLAGVPDLFSRMGPALRHTLRRPSRGRHRDRARAPAVATGLTRRARLLVTAWALLAVPTILVNLVALVVSAPFVLPRTARAVREQLAPAGPAIRDGRLLSAAADTVAAMVVALPAAGTLCVLFLLTRTALRMLHHRSALARARRRRRPAAGRSDAGGEQRRDALGAAEVHPGHLEAPRRAVRQLDHQHTGHPAALEMRPPHHGPVGGGDDRLGRLRTQRAAPGGEQDDVGGEDAQVAELAAGEYGPAAVPTARHRGTHRATDGAADRGTDHSDGFDEGAHHGRSGMRHG
ncbi:conserved membrane hypothetical protein [Frankia canadensis]|uniref:Peptide zinc metalloprotease protein n=1 Tax=Frankia canadensis TaxID=1836972 RepID=A0A2I2KXK7_9ACTN|nr:hypothetical protein [Frankia canadensis]SNQ50389.1 conserved membrane hypothetical protein [Frankia canadensis]SOU57679.1 conserved membrane hypothetical protein [Frankia canadensis]